MNTNMTDINAELMDDSALESIAPFRIDFNSDFDTDMNELQGSEFATLFPVVDELLLALPSEEISQIPEISEKPVFTDPPSGKLRKNSHSHSDTAPYTTRAKSSPRSPDLDERQENLSSDSQEVPSERKWQRKIKNRQSAQLSRQRKKEYTEELEERVQMLSTSKNSLEHRVTSLKSQQETLRIQMHSLVAMIQNSVFFSSVLASASAATLVSLGIASMVERQPQPQPARKPETFSFHKSTELLIEA
jgi:hypothetical protein